ncbi:hypothetical protein EVA_20535 [gut metagenome]|uniref:Uncharacterized protein n=1 Tax=gut metagenome TaxID=749906 RepID=J9FVF1_9ZZZZ
MTGYSISASIFLEISRAKSTAEASSITSGLTMIRISRPACTA